MKRVLIAEDEEILRMLITDTLEELDLNLDLAEDGQMALAKMNQQSYDLCILDYMMPQLTGIDVLHRIDPARKENLPILMLTAKTQETDKQAAMAAGVRYFMPKPFSPLDLQAAVREILYGRSVGGEN